MSNTISVIIPIYNCAPSIGNTLDSILSQAFTAAEIIAINDGSTDETVSIVGNYAPAVRLINIDNIGPTGARLAGVRAAKSDWLAFCDSDDLWHRDHLSTLMDLAEPNGVPFAFSNFRHVQGGRAAEKSHFECDPTGFWMKPGRAVGNDGFIADSPLFLEVLSYQAVFPSCTVVRKDFLESVGSLNSALGRNVSEDLEFTLRCVRKQPTGIITRPTVEVHRHERNYTVDWIRTLAGSIEILRHARVNHALPEKHVEAVDREIISRSIRGIDCCFAARRPEDVGVFAANLSKFDTPLKTAIKIAVATQPRPLARLLNTALTAGRSATRVLHRGDERAST